MFPGFSWLKPRGDPMCGQGYKLPERERTRSDEYTDEFYLGLDLGQSQDPTALVALRKRCFPPLGPGGKRPPATYTVRGAKRWPLKTKYTSIVDEVVQLVNGTEESAPLRGCTLGIDKTGVGAAVVDLFTKAKPDARIRP